MIHTIASKWSELETDMLRNGVEKDHVSANRKVFYCGAYASLVVLSETMGMKEITAAMTTNIEKIESEIITTLRETQS